MRVLIRAFAVAVLVTAALTGSEAFAAIKVVATTEDLASLAREVGGDKVQVDAARQGLPGPALRRPETELHPQAEPRRPADRRRPRARDRLAAAAHHQQPQRQDSAGQHGYLDASQNVKILEIPTGQITRAMGDVHPLGNPHYWLDPGNGRKIAQAIRDKLSRARRPPTRPTSPSATPTSTSGWPTREKRWDATMAPVQGHQDRDLSPVVAELHGAIRPRRHRLRRAEARHPAVAVAHARAHRGDEAPERQADRRRAVLRPEDAAGDRRIRSAARCWCSRHRSAAPRRRPTTSSCSSTTSTCWRAALKQVTGK